MGLRVAFVTLMLAVSIVFEAAGTRVETFYALRGRIRPVYLGDAVIEALFVLGLLFARRPRDGAT